MSRSALNASRRPTNNFLLAFWTDVLASNAAVVAPAAVPIFLSALLLLFCFLLLISHNHFTSHVYKCVCVCVSVSEVKHLRLLEAQNPGCLSDNDDDDKDEQSSSSSRRQEEK